MESLETPRPERKITILNLDKPVWERIKFIAEREERTAIGLVRRFLREGLEKYETGARDR